MNKKEGAEDKETAATVVSLTFDSSSTGQSETLLTLELSGVQFSSLQFFIQS